MSRKKFRRLINFSENTGKTKKRKKTKKRRSKFRKAKKVTDAVFLRKMKELDEVEDDYNECVRVKRE